MPARQELEALGLQQLRAVSEESFEHDQMVRTGSMEQEGSPRRRPASLCAATSMPRRSACATAR